MTENRFKWVFIKDNELEFRDNGIVKRFDNYRLEEFLNELHKENEQLKFELSKQKEISPKKEIERLKKIIFCLREENIDLNEELMEYDSFKKLSKKDGEELME